MKKQEEKVERPLAAPGCAVRPSVFAGNTYPHTLLRAADLGTSSAQDHSLYLMKGDQYW